MIPGVPTFAVYLVGAIALTSAAGGLWIHGHRSGADAVRAEVDATRVAQAEAAMVKLNEEITRGNELSTKLEAAQRKVRGLAASRHRVVDRLDNCGGVPAAFVRVLDDAAASRVSSDAEASGESACTPSTVTTAHAASIIASNYDTCNEQAAQLGLLIDWVEGQP
jgi:hypothetical protein